jgi:hypothetical protein
MSGNTPYHLDDEDDDLDYLDDLDTEDFDADDEFVDFDEFDDDEFDDDEFDDDEYEADEYEADDTDEDQDNWDNEDDDLTDDVDDFDTYDNEDDTDDEDFDLDDLDDFDDFDDFDEDDEDDEDQGDTGDTTTGADEKDAIIKSLRKENAARRKKLQELREQSMGAVEEAIAETMTQLAEQLGIDPDPNTDNILNTLTEKIHAAEKDRLDARRDLAIYKAAAPLKVDIARLADSKKFTQTIDELDPTDDNYATDVAQAVKAAVEANPYYRTSGQLDRSGGDFTGGNTQPVESGVEARRVQRQKRRGIKINNPKG